MQASEKDKKANRQLAECPKYKCCIMQAREREPQKEKKKEWTIPIYAVNRMRRKKVKNKLL